MPVLLTDADIERLVRQCKELPPDFHKRMVTRPKRGHKEQELGLTGADGAEFRLILRQADASLLDFSVILAYHVPKTNQLFRLRRYNGKHGEHTNCLEGETFYDFHIHVATERYQDSGLREDSYATPTERYSDFEGAIDCLLGDCGFVLPPDGQLTLF